MEKWAEILHRSCYKLVSIKTIYGLKEFFFPNNNHIIHIIHIKKEMYKNQIIMLEILNANIKSEYKTA